MKLIWIIIGLMLVCGVVSAAEDVTFTVKDTSWEYNSHNGDFYFYIETTSDQLYWIKIKKVSDVFSLNPVNDTADKVCETYERFAPNTTHTVNVEGHQVIL